MEIKNLKPNPDNPRLISPEKLKQLKKALREFGDLSGIVFNRKTQTLVSGHQRVKVLDDMRRLITIETNYPKPTRTGTVAEGYLKIEGEKFRYREVDWDAVRQQAATLAANKTAGEWDNDKLSVWLKEIDDFAFDLDLTMFDEAERSDFFKTDSDKTPSNVDEKPKDLPQREVIECPNCGYIRGLTPGKKTT